MNQIYAHGNFVTQRMLIMLAILYFITGCAAKMYTPPQGPKSSLTFHSNTDSVLIQVFADRRCTKLANGVRLAYLHDRYASPIKGTKKTIESRAPVVVSATWASSGVAYMRCTAAVEFVAAPQAQYQVVYQRRGLNCSIQIYRDVVRGGQIFQEPEPTASSLKDPCFSGMD